MFDDRIKKLRLARGITQAQAADDLNLPQKTYCNYERDEREPNSTVLVKLALYYGVSTDYLLGFIPQNEKNAFLTSDELSHIKKYRTLDEYGKEAVDNVLDVEHRRCTAESKPETIKVLTAARSVDGQTPIRYEEMTREEYEKLINAPETDEDF